MKLLISFFLITIFTIIQIQAQWTNRYPKLQGLSHHVYLEGFELPIMNAGPTDPVCSPVKDELIFAAKGWLWLFDLKQGTATRITFSGDIDSRPSWSPDGDRLVFIRDTGIDTKIMMMDLKSRQESLLVDTDAIDLDPSFTEDGEFVIYSSADSGNFDLWKIDLSTKEKSLIIREDGQERMPVQKHNQIFFLKKRGRSFDSIEKFDPDEKVSTTMAKEYIASQMTFAISPDGSSMAYTWPVEDDYQVRLLSVNTPSSSILLTTSEGLPMMPAFNRDGTHLYFVENQSNERTRLKRIPVNGGKPEVINIKSWDYGSETATIKIKSELNGSLAPVRLRITTKDGHPVIPESGTIRQEGQHGSVFFYSAGETTLQTVPGEITVTAVHGLLSTPVSKKIIAKAGETIEATIELTELWSARENGWYSGDNHFHLNYGGTYQLAPEDIALDLKGENLDIAYPLLANLHNRYLEKDLWGWKQNGRPVIRFGQEVRSHFLGHLGLIGIDSLYWPWIWGPYYEVYSNDDRLNAEPLQYTRNQGGLGSYVHPVSIRNPFEAGGARYIPVSMVADCVLETVDLVEIACLWTDEIGTATVWHQFLNLGIPIAPSAGSDVMNDYYRTMAIGSSRVYVKPDGNFSEESYLDALKKGKSFVTTGPALEFTLEGIEPGGVIKSDRKNASWLLKVHSTVPYEKAELFINGEVVWSGKGTKKTGTTNYSGKINIPSGGWITARVSGGESEWPMMESYPFAETGPIWFQEIGSYDPVKAQLSAAKLLEVLEVSEKLLISGYGDSPVPKLRNHFGQARQKLRSFMDK